MISSTHYARCPGCQTVFRVSDAQLALREGQVRCGHCRAVFDANRERVALETGRSEVDEHRAHDATTTEITGAPSSTDAVAPPEGTGPAELTVSTEHVGPAEVAATTEHAETAEPAAETQHAEPAKLAAATEHAEIAPEAPATEERAPTELSETPPTETSAVENAGREPEITESAAPIPIDGIASRASRYEWKPRKTLRERPRALYGTAIVVLGLAIAAQALFEYRDALAARAPFVRPILETACAPFGCRIEPLHDAAALSIDASDLRADPAHRGLLKLSATIRNRASYPIAWPYLELTLTDASDRVVARRAFAPREYVAGTRSESPGLAPNGEEIVTLFLDVSESSQSGYRLYLFYP